ncbi:VWA domain-containing protein [Kribbella turkmenica]|uniref:VWA domain-containing protein n=1 Tax=Kribbella turkmenica TaxID=2530375 RepID=A0A4R4XCJ6_9ACTN|nr:VWA domain-containing protein [Kribbella turkmenica]TDD28363.1 VWA domain-containing protein [Kribbella turkmenica]
MIRVVQLRPAHLLAAELRWTSGTSATNRPKVSYQLGNPGRPSTDPTITIVIADDSGSVIGPAGADPVSNRYEEAWRAFRAIGGGGAKHEFGAVLHFDTPTSRDVPPTPLTRSGLQQLRSGLRFPRDSAGTSCLGPSLTAATNLANQYPNHTATLIVLSDFELFDDNAAQVLDDLADFPGDVHAVTLGGTRMDGILHHRIHVTPVTDNDPPGTLARAVFGGLTARRPGSWVAER